MAFWSNWFNKNKINKQKHNYVKTIKIQGGYIEGKSNNLIIESLLTARRLNISIPGTGNAFTS